MRIEASTNSLTVILPAAGLGTRMGSPNAKEIMINPRYEIPYIQFAIESVSDILCRIIVVTRAEKTQLVDWVTLYKTKNPSLNMELFFIQKTTEWPDTVLQAKPVWSKYNIVLLPDTDWKPKNQIRQVWEQLSVTEAVYSVFSTNQTKWGFVKINTTDFELVEKPSQIFSGFKAWGHIGFRDSIGSSLLTAHLKSTFDHEVKKLDFQASTLDLEEFFDRTRGE